MKKKLLITLGIIIAMAVSSVVGFAVAAMNAPKHPSDYKIGITYDKALESDKPMLALFYVDWCGYCQKFAPIFDELIKSKDVKKKYAVAFVNCDNKDNQKIIQEYNVLGFPTVFLLNPKTGEKKQLDNYKFFIPNAKEELIRDLKEFLRPKE